MCLTKFAFIKLHSGFNHVSYLSTVGDLLSVIVATTTLTISTSLFAGSRLPDTDTAPVVDLPVVKLEQTGTLTQLLDQLDDARVVLVGENHTRYDHHMVQLEIFRQLYQKFPTLVLGVEWFQQPFQEHLDEYIAGKITEKEMLKRTEYFNRWSYDYRLYQPIMRYAREHEIPVIALNAPRELLRALTTSGFDDLPAELKVQLPESYDWTDKKYQERLRKVFDLHPEYNGEFDDFLRSQLTWDESMAERASEHLQENPDSRMLILAGSGHIMFGSGIPNRIQRRIDTEPFSILVSEDSLPASRDIADFLVLSTEQSLEPVGLIGAFLGSKGKLLVITGFTPDSAAKDAGLQKGTVIIGVDDHRVEGLADFKLAVMAKKPGDSIELHYLESAEAGKKEAESMRIELR